MTWSTPVRVESHTRGCVSMCVCLTFWKTHETQHHILNMCSDAQHRAKHHARKRAVTSMSTIVMCRKLKRVQVWVEDNSRMLLFLSEKNVPRLKQFVARHWKIKWVSNVLSWNWRKRMKRENGEFLGWGWGVMVDMCPTQSPHPTSGSRISSGVWGFWESVLVWP